MSTKTIDVLGATCDLEIPDNATVVRAIVVASYELIDEDGNAVEGSHWGASHMGTDARVGMIHRAYRSIADDWD